ncbi:MAG: hypothetical protein ACRC0V_12415, partial [Fusobacteriaceae bacterium]
MKKIVASFEVLKNLIKRVGQKLDVEEDHRKDNDFIFGLINTGEEKLKKPFFNFSLTLPEIKEIISEYKIELMYSETVVMIKNGK